MPLTKKGLKAKEGFEEEYGKRGTSVFYAFMSKHPKKTKKWHKVRIKPYRRGGRRVRGTVAARSYDV